MLHRSASFRIYPSIKQTEALGFLVGRVLEQDKWGVETVERKICALLIEGQRIKARGVLPLAPERCQRGTLLIRHQGSWEGVMRIKVPNLKARRYQEEAKMLDQRLAQLVEMRDRKRLGSIRHRQLSQEIDQLSVRNKKLNALKKKQT